ncbi:MAG: DNA protecting protein DprA [Epulopiscium sp. Nele67-Bin004]|nr:MAG: DNA protecting protein DprA [Epulopiscium sp. Nele67-Bin004]
MEIYSIWLNSLNMSERIKLKLYNKTGGAKQVFELSQNDCRELKLNDRQANTVLNHKSKLEDAEKILEVAKKEKIDIIDIGSKYYPELLKNIDDAPIVLYGRGDKKHLRGIHLSMVGARHCSEYGYNIAKNLAQKLSDDGVTIVSGLAEGIDSGAHKGALLGAKSTIAVLGTGVDICYPTSNRDLYARIANEGYIISEYAPKTEIRAYHFPRRNRIISGMTLGTIVVEAATRSGSLITADRALEQNRIIFSVPGNIDSKLSKGTNDLIKNGAKLVVNKTDIIEELPDYIKMQLDVKNNNDDKKNKNSLDKMESLVYDCVSREPIPREQVQQKANIETGTLDMVLIRLELKKFVQRIPGNRYMRLK